MASDGTIESEFEKSHVSSSHSVIPEEDESEWEYEYSTTEAETFYVTLDLSKVDFTGRDPATPYHGRAGYREHQAIEGSDVERSARDNAPKGNLGFQKPNARKRAWDDDLDEGEDEEEDGQEDSVERHKVQIMELHSANPIVSYKGRVYEAQWCENVGTELLFTRREKSNPSSLPVLRHLDQDVELLAASCARIDVQERYLKPKAGARPGPSSHPTQQNSQTGHSSKNDNLPDEKILPAPEPDASKERIDQGKFLAELIALKKRKGEKDEVTVIAKGNKRAGRDKVHLINSTRARRGKERGVDTGGQSGSRVSRGHERGRDSPRRSRGRPRGSRTRVDLLDFTERETSVVPATKSTMSPRGTSVSGGSSISDPTPEHWDDLRLQENIREQEREEQDEIENDASMQGIMELGRPEDGGWSGSSQTSGGSGDADEDGNGNEDDEEAQLEESEIDSGSGILDADSDEDDLNEDEYMDIDKEDG